VVAGVVFRDTTGRPSLDSNGAEWRKAWAKSDENHARIVVSGCDKAAVLEVEDAAAVALFFGVDAVAKAQQGFALGVRLGQPEVRAAGDAVQRNGRGPAAQDALGP
jgi:hypothetical protein